MGFQKFGTGEVLGQDDNDAQGIQSLGAGERPWTQEDAVELERESTTDAPAETIGEA